MTQFLPPLSKWFMDLQRFFVFPTQQQLLALARHFGLLSSASARRTKEIMHADMRGEMKHFFAVLLLTTGMKRYSRYKTQYPVIFCFPPFVCEGEEGARLTPLSVREKGKKWTRKGMKNCMLVSESFVSCFVESLEGNRVKVASVNLPQLVIVA